MTNIPKDKRIDEVTMFVRNFQGQIVQIKREDFLNEKEFYHYLWKIKYNIDISKQTISFNDALIDYCKGINFLI